MRHATLAGSIAVVAILCAAVAVPICAAEPQKLICTAKSRSADHKFTVIVADGRVDTFWYGSADLKTTRMCAIDASRQAKSQSITYDSAWKDGADGKSTVTLMSDGREKGVAFIKMDKKEIQIELRAKDMEEYCVFGASIARTATMILDQKTCRLKD